MSRPPVRPAVNPNPRHEKQPHVICRLVQVDNNTFDKLEDARKLQQFEDAFLQFHALKSKTADFNLLEFLDRAADNRSLVSKASIVGFLCDCVASREIFLEFILVSSSKDDWQDTLTSMNKVILDGFTLLRPIIRIRFVQLLQFFVTQNPANLESVLNNFFRELNAGGNREIEHLVELAEATAEFVLRNREWFTRKCFNLPLIPCVVSTLSRFLADLPAGNERVQNLLSFVVDMLLRERFRDMLYMGRDLILLLLRLSKFPVFRPYWKSLLHNPRLLLTNNIDSLPKLIRAKCTKNIVPSRIAFKLQYVIDHLLTYKPDLVYQYYSDWFVRDYLSGFDSGSLRAEVIRFVVCYRQYNITEALKQARILFLIRLLTSCKNLVDYQLAKLALCFDWFCTDGSEPYSHGYYAQLDVLPSILKYCLAERSLGSLANSLVDFCVRGLMEIYPDLTAIFLANFANSMRIIMATQPSFPKLFDNPRIDKGLRTSLSCLFPDYFGKLPAESENNVPKPEEQPATTRKREASLELEDEKPAEKRSKLGTVQGSTLGQSCSTEVSQLVSDEEKQHHAIKLREASAKLTGEIKKKFETFSAVVAKNGLASGEASDAARAFFGRLRAVKVEDSQLIILAECIASLYFPLLSSGEFYKQWKDNPKNVVFALFENWQTSKTQKTAGRQTFSQLIGYLSPHIPLLGSLLIFYNTISASSPALYKEYASLMKLSVPELFSNDLSFCALEEPELLSFIFSKLDWLFPEAAGSVEVVEAICNFTNEQQLYPLIGTLTTSDTVALFKKETFTALARKSLEWNTLAQWVFWKLVEVEMVPTEWITMTLADVTEQKNPLACSNILNRINSKEVQIGINLARHLFFRPLNDSLTITLLKIMLTEPNSMVLMAEKVYKILSKLLASQRVYKPDKTPNESESQYGSVQHVLSHLNQILKEGEDENLQQFLSCEWFMTFCQAVNKRSDVDKLKRSNPTLFSFWLQTFQRDAKKEKEDRNKPSKKKRKESKELSLRRKKSVDYNEESEDETEESDD